jgi:hypothetical protein
VKLNCKLFLTKLIYQPVFLVILISRKLTNTVTASAEIQIEHIV